jgi:integrase
MHAQAQNANAHFLPCVKGQKLETITTQTPADKFAEFLKTQRDYVYLQRCMQEIPCIDWLDFTAKMYRRNHKVSTAFICAKSMYFFNEAYKTQKTGKTLCDELARIKRKNDVKRTYELIDHFVGYCETVKQLQAGSTSVYVRGVRRMFRHMGVKIDSKDFADKVIMPKPKPARNEYPADEQIRLILSMAGPRIRLFVNTLSETGLGRGEAIRLRPKCYKFDEDPVRIITERFKTGEYIETFCTKETGEETRKFIEANKLGPDDFIFIKNIGKRGADKVAEQYAKVLAKAGLDEKIEGHKYRKFHLHVYRARWFTKAINVVPAYIAHAMLGRKQYLDQYLAHPLSDRQAFYKKIAKHVSVHTREQDAAERRKDISSWLGIEVTPEIEARLKTALFRLLDEPKSLILQELSP